MVPKAAEVRLTPEDRSVLEARLRSPTTEQRDVLRARIVLLADEGRSTRSIAKAIEVMPRTVSLARLQFLPPYSPDFNPIENAFAKFKALLRKAAERTVEGLWTAVGDLLEAFTPAECANYFIAAGYEPD